MPIANLYSHRKRVAEGQTPDVFAYDELSRELRVQIIHIWRDAIGPYYQYGDFEAKNQLENNEAWELIHKTIAREHGLFSLGDKHRIDNSCELYLLKTTSVDAALDLIEATFFYIDNIAIDFGASAREDRGITQEAGDAIAELNERFLRAGVGYRFEEGRILRVDSELVHSEIVRPTLRFLNEPGFEGPRDEFLRAHGHYRSGEIEDAITDANNAFESTLKAVCDQRGWSYGQGARASDLLKIVRREGLLPKYLDKSFDQLSATLSSGLPQVRNEMGAHGQGSTPRTTPGYVGAYALHLAAANILFIVEAHKEMN